MKIIFDRQFQTDFKQIVRHQPHIKDEIRELIYTVEEIGEIPPTYNPHQLTNPRGTYTGYWGIHLQEGVSDVVVVYHQLRKNQTIRFIRIGSHRQLFQGKEL